MAGAKQSRNSQFSKTKMCRFELLGMCAKGPQCPFAHGSEELRPLPDLRCTRLCREFLQSGHCSNKSCTYAHSKDELRVSVEKPAASVQRLRRPKAEQPEPPAASPRALLAAPGSPAYVPLRSPGPRLDSLGGKPSPQALVHSVGTLRSGSSSYAPNAVDPGMMSYQGGFGEEEQARAEWEVLAMAPYAGFSLDSSEAGVQHHPPGDNLMTSTSWSNWNRWGGWGHWTGGPGLWNGWEPGGGAPASTWGLPSRGSVFADPHEELSPLGEMVFSPLNDAVSTWSPPRTPPMKAVRISESTFCTLSDEGSQGPDQSRRGH